MNKTLTLLAAALLVLAPASLTFADNDNGKSNNGQSGQVSGQHQDQDDEKGNKDDKKDKDAKGGYGGGQITKVEVCRATGSDWLPYVKVTVPTATAEKWVAADKAMYPINGECPKPEKTIREYVRERLASIFDRLPFLARR